MRFALAGAVLFALKLWLLPAQQPVRPLSVAVRADASPAQIQAAIDEAILVDLAVREGWAHTDAVVRGRLLASLEAASDLQGDRDAAVERALALGLAQRDPLARARLASQARRALELRGEQPPTEATLALELHEHADHYRLPGRVTFQQVFLSRQARGASLQADAARVATILGERADDAAAAAGLARLGLADPWPWTSEGASISVARLDALAGDGFGAAVARAPEGHWSGPLPSSFGLHFVWLEQVTAPRLPSVTEKRARLSETALLTARGERFERAMTVLRGQYKIRLEAAP